MNINSLYNQVRFAIEHVESLKQELESVQNILTRVYNELSPQSRRPKFPDIANPVLNGENKLPERDMDAVWAEHRKNDPLMTGVEVTFKPLDEEVNNDLSK